ncbi:30S ribosomal protein S12 methylthiotransferase RimO [Ruminococcaceae bacterium OttesenSCG-928-A11]|nr:30S ribosomal protein S12 methylthiotransferase RimO [Ruminococcaceae bacterium OttesenSCG-928-A11]
MKLAVLSLGCPKNQVDADRFTRALIDAGHTTVPRLDAADAIIINTCGFIQSAKEEAIEAIFDACALKKKQNPALKVVVTGCLAERYQGEVANEIPELDAVVGIGANGSLPEILEKLAAGLALSGETRPKAPLQAYGPKAALSLEGSRVISTPAHYAWLKVAEGCSNHCSYCAIPGIRGPLRSRPMESVLAEAEWLADQGVKELVLVAQDVTAYGDDTGHNQAVPLLKALEAVSGPRWIRILYAYPERITPELLEVMAASEKIVPYLDLPIQHCNEEILRSMGRRGGAQAVRDAVGLIREKLPGATLRTTLIAGYPGETEAIFEELCAFVQAVRFDRLGCFAYSPEEGTRAADLPNQVPEAERQRRAEIIMEIQAGIMAEKLEAMAGETLEVICDGLDEDENVWLCRSKADAPEIDVNVLVAAKAPMAPGGFYTVTVSSTEGCDLIADFIAPVAP